MLERLSVGCLDGRILVENHVPDTLGWLHEMIAPAFAVQPAPSADRADGTISLAIEAAERPQAAERTSLGPTACFALDREVVRLPAWREGTSIVIDDPPFRARYTVDADHVGVGPIGTAHHLRGGSFRLLRETMMSRLDWARHVQLHASAVASSGRVVLFAGAREAGKTSLLAHLSASAGAGLVSNDRVVVSAEPEGWEARGVPTIVRVRPGTIERLPHLFGPWSVPVAAQPVMFTREELEHAPRAPLGATSSPLMLSLAQLADVVGSALHPGGRLACVALVAIDNDIDPYLVRPLSPAEAERRLDGARLGVTTEPREATVFERVVGGGVEAIAPAVRLAQLAAEVPCVEVAIGRGLLASPEAGRALLHELLDVG